MTMTYTRSSFAGLVLAVMTLMLAAGPAQAQKDFDFDQQFGQVDQGPPLTIRAEPSRRVVEPGAQLAIAVEFELAEQTYASLIADRNDPEVKNVGLFGDMSYVPLAQTYLLDADATNDGLAEQLLIDVVNGTILDDPTAPMFRDGLVELVDLFPTLLALAGGAPAEGVDIDGRDITAFLKGQAAAPRSPFFYYLEDDIAAVREGRWKAHYHRREFAPNGKLRQSKRLAQPELYDLDRDPSESIDLAEANPEIVRRLAALGERFHASITPTMVLPSPKSGVASGIMRGAPNGKKKQADE